MAELKIEIKQGQIESVKDELIILFTPKFEKGKFNKLQKYPFLKDPLNDSDFTGKANKTFSIPTFENVPSKRILLVGLGDILKIDLETLRRAVSTAINYAKNLKIKSFSLEMPHTTFSLKEKVYAIAEGLLLGNYSFSKYKTEDRKENVEIEKVTIFVEKDTQKASEFLKESVIICNNVNDCRDIVNENASLIYPESFANCVRKTLNGLKITVFDEKRIHSEGMGLLEAVGIGSIHPPRLVIAEYRGDTRSKKTTVIVGKGITYDTGGYNLKLTGFIETMKCDMAGAAAVLYTLKTLKDLKIKQNVVGIMSLAENCVSDRSYKPGDIFTSYSGKTVEIGNTDAEGRLVLADAISYSKKFNPDTIIDLATLTGACMIALGEHISGLFTENDELAENLNKSSKKTFDRIWRLPMYEEIKDLMKSDFADINNLGSNRFGGAIQGAVFLQKFVPEGVKWAHLDIAGPAFLAKANFYNPKGATGYGVRLLAEYFRGL